MNDIICFEQSESKFPLREREFRGEVTLTIFHIGTMLKADLSYVRKN